MANGGGWVVSMVWLDNGKHHVKQGGFVKIHLFSDELVERVFRIKAYRDRAISWSKEGERDKISAFQNNNFVGNVPYHLEGVLPNVPNDCRNYSVWPGDALAALG